MKRLTILTIVLVVLLTSCGSIGDANKEKQLFKVWTVESINGQQIDYESTVEFKDDNTFVIKEGDYEVMFNWTWCDEDNTKLAYSTNYNMDCDSRSVMIDMDLSRNRLEYYSMSSGEPIKIVLTR